MHIKYFKILIPALLICIGWAAAVDNPQGNNPVCGPCSSYGLDFSGPLEYTPYPGPLNDGAQNPEMVYVVYSVIDDESRPWWTQATGVWQAWGPYEFKAGKNYILEFGPQDYVGMTEGPLPYYVEGTSAWLQVENVDYWDENSYAYCIVPESRFQEYEVDIEDEEIFSSNNVYGVSSNPTAPTTFSIHAPLMVTYVMNYHYLNQGGLPGIITLRHTDGTTYGPWQATGREGQGMVSNAYWEVRPYAIIKPGTYTILDSNPVTWSQNQASGGRGMSEVRGVYFPNSGVSTYQWSGNGH